MIMRNSFLTEVYKPKVSQTVLDETANVVLAYCITSIFLIKNKGMKLLPSHFIKLLKYLERGKTSMDFASMETISNTYDQITLNTPLSEDTRQFVLDNLKDRTNPHFCMVRSIIDFVNNNTKFNDLVNQVTNNGEMNSIVIDVDNVSADEPKTTNIMIDSKKISLFDSILPIFDHHTGVGGIGQKELKQDYGYDSQRKFLKSSFGVDIGEDSSVYYHTAHNNNQPTKDSLELATRQLYNELCKRINQGFDGLYDSPVNDFRYNLISSMLGCCYGVNRDNDCVCLVIPSNKVTYESFNVKELFNKLYTATLYAKCPENMNPSIRILDDENRELFQLRFKKEKYADNLTGHRYKLYFKPNRVNEYFKE